MVLVPAGGFSMGSTAAEIAAVARQHRQTTLALLQDETPRHEVWLEAFYIDVYEVTNARFQQFVQATGYRPQAEREGWGTVRQSGTWQKVPGATWRTPQGADSNLVGLAEHPVVQTSWHDAVAYCTWAGKRLPTEAEWEKAGRGPDGRTYPWGNAADGTRVNACDQQCRAEWRDNTFNDGYARTAPVGAFTTGVSPYGVYDMAGNVWEWVADRYAARYYQNSPRRAPRGPTTGSEVVLRGGSWLYPAPSFRLMTRAGAPADRRNDNIGIRCARTP